MTISRSLALIKMLSVVVLSSVAVVACQPRMPTAQSSALSKSERDVARCAIHGATGGPVCGYSFTEVITGRVPSGAVRLDGYLVEHRGSLFLFMSSDAAKTHNFSEALVVTAIDDAMYKDAPGLFQNKLVRVIGTYSAAPVRVVDSGYQTHGKVRVVAINHYDRHL